MSTRARAGILAAVALVAATLALALTCGPLSSSASASETITIRGEVNSCATCGQVFNTQSRDWFKHMADTGHKTHGTVEQTKQIEGEYVYRLYNPISSEHLFTTSVEEYNNLTAHYWQQEGDSWTSPATSSAGVYRLYNPGLGALGKMSHHYTTDKAEADDLVKNHGWVYDNGGQPIFYSAVDSSGSMDVYSYKCYRLYNSGLSAHHYTPSLTEESVLTNCGRGGDWVDEGYFFVYLNEGQHKSNGM